MHPVYGVYALTNTETKGITKIGMTLRHIKDRLRELNGSTSTIGEFKCEMFLHCENPSGLEQELHSHFADQHVNKEYFRVSPEEVQELAIEFLAGQDFEIVIKANNTSEKIHPGLDIIMIDRPLISEKYHHSKEVDHDLNIEQSKINPSSDIPNKDILTRDIPNKDDPIKDDLLSNLRNDYNRRLSILMSEYKSKGNGPLNLREWRSFARANKHRLAPMPEDAIDWINE